MQSGGPANAVRQIATQLVDGHWVLSFADNDLAEAAQNLVHRCASSLRDRLGAAIEPLLEVLCRFSCQG